LQRFACREWLAQGGSLQVVAAWRAVAAGANIEDGRADGALAGELRATPPALRRRKLLAHLRGALAQAAGGNADVSDGRRFFDMGLDSVGGVTLVAELERGLDLVLDPTLIYEHPTPAALADHLLARLFDAAEMRRAAGTATTADADMRALEALLASDS
jgi:acyl carrier protein